MNILYDISFDSNSRCIILLLGKMRGNVDESFAGNEINSNAKRIIEVLVTKCYR